MPPHTKSRRAVSYAPAEERVSSSGKEKKFSRSKIRLPSWKGFLRVVTLRGKKDPALPGTIPEEEEYDDDDDYSERARPVHSRKETHSRGRVVRRSVSHAQTSRHRTPSGKSWTASSSQKRYASHHDGDFADESDDSSQVSCSDDDDYEESPLRRRTSSIHLRREVQSGGRRRVRRRESGRQESVAARRASQANGRQVFGQKRSIHVCSDCDGVRSPQFHHIHGGSLRRNFCTKCQIARLEAFKEDPTGDFEQFCFHCGQVRTKEFSKLKPEAQHRVIANFCEECIAHIKSRQLEPESDNENDDLESMLPSHVSFQSNSPGDRDNMGILLDDEFFSDSTVGNGKVAQCYKRLFVPESKSTKQSRESKETVDATPKVHGILKDSGRHSKPTAQSKANSISRSPSSDGDPDTSPSPAPIRDPKSHDSNSTKVTKQAAEEDEQIRSDIESKDKKGKRPVRGQGLKMSKTYASVPHEKESDTSSDDGSASTLGKPRKSYSKARVVAGMRISSPKVAHSSPKGRTPSGGNLSRGKGKSTQSTRKSTHGESVSSSRKASARELSGSSSKRNRSNSTARGSNMHSGSAPEDFANDLHPDLARRGNESHNTSNARLDSDIYISQRESAFNRNRRVPSGAHPEASVAGTTMPMPPSMHPGGNFDMASPAYNPRGHGPGGRSRNTRSRIFSSGTFGDDYPELGEDAVFPPPRTDIPSSSRAFPNISENEPLYDDEPDYGYMHAGVQPNMTPQNHRFRHPRAMAQPYAPSPAAGVNYPRPGHNAFNAAGAAGPSGWSHHEHEEEYDDMYEVGDNDDIIYGSNFGMNHGQNGVTNRGLNHGPNFGGMNYGPNLPRYGANDHPGHGTNDVHNYDPSFGLDHNPNHGVHNGPSFNPNGGLNRGHGRGHNWGVNYGFNHGPSPSHDPRLGLDNDRNHGPTTPVGLTSNGNHGDFAYATGAAAPREAQDYAAASHAHNNGQGAQFQDNGNNPFTNAWGPPYVDENGQVVDYPFDTSSFESYVERSRNRAWSAPREGHDILGNPYPRGARNQHGYAAGQADQEPSESAFGGPSGYPPPGFGDGHDQPPFFA